MKEIFSYNADINKTAYMNWRTNSHNHIYNMIVIADGFMESAILLAKTALDDNSDKKADGIVYPMLFNANHAIELYLKALTWTLNILLKSVNKIEGQHNIQQIFQVVEKRVLEFETDKDRRKEFKKMIEGIRFYIDELFDKISDQTGNKRKDNMDFSRYPFDQQYIPHFYINEFDNVVVDLENFVERFKDIGENLRLLSTYYLFDCLEAGE